MNFLQLVQATRQECEGAYGSTLSTVIGQTGENKRFVDWVNNAWLEIQGRNTAWSFMRGAFSFNTVAGTGTGTGTSMGDYAVATVGITDFKHYHQDTFRCYLTSIGLADEQFLPFWDYAPFRDTYRYGTRMVGRPTVFSVSPANELMFGAVPDGIYTVVGEYQKRASSMTLDASTPTIPDHLHMIIVYKAMEYYALYESAAEVLTRARTQYQTLLNQLAAECLPEVTLGDPLA